jgi:hypothetical protein
LLGYKNKHPKVTSPVAILALASLYALGSSIPAHAAVQRLVFPVIGPSSYSNDFDAPRNIGGTHRATDIMANKHQKVVSASNGTIQYIATDRQSGWETAGYSIRILGTDGYTYNYYHLNNDTKGTDDGNGGHMNAFAADVEPGNPVVRGQHIGYVGDSGNAETTPPHLHFEIRQGSTAVNPYYHLNSAVRISEPRVYPQLSGELLPYGNGGFRGGSRLAYADIDGDGSDEIVTGAGPGGRYVKVFDETGSLVISFLPNGDSFTGGVDVAAADIDGDGSDEIVTGAGPGGRYVKVFEMNGASATQISKFIPYGGFDGGVSVSGGDVAIGLGEEIITGARKGGGPRVSIFAVDGTLIKSFYAYSSMFKGGVRVESSELEITSLQMEIVTIPETKGSGRVKVFSGGGSPLGFSDYASEDWWIGYYDVAASTDQLLTSLNVNRRTSIRGVDY